MLKRDPNILVSSLHYSSCEKAEYILELARSLGLDVNKAINKMGQTTCLIYWICRNHPRYVASVKFLIDNGADPRLTDENGYNAFCHARKTLDEYYKFAIYYIDDCEKRNQFIAEKYSEIQDIIEALKTASNEKNQN